MLVAAKPPVALAEIELAPSVLTTGQQEGLAAIAAVSDDAQARVAHARGKSYRDLVAKKNAVYFLQIVKEPMPEPVKEGAAEE